MADATQTTSDLKGDLLSVKMFGATGDGATDDSTAFQEAIDYLFGKGGGVLRVPKTNSGFYKLDVPVTVKAKVLLQGEGDGSLLFRGAAMPAGDGLLIIDGEDAGVQDLKIDGDVTTITNLLYGAGTSSVLFNNDPMDSKLTLNTSIWIRPGAHNFWISGVTITHTGGYSILVDVIDGDTRNGAILDCFFENNRPHLFGVDAGTPANNIYGAWTGGIFVKGDCTTAAAKLFAMRGLTIRGCKFHRMNGNCVWSHSNGFDTHHENFVFDQNVFRYIARDGYMIGNVEGGHAHGSMSYVGFTHTTDVDAPAGAYLANNYAVGFDAAGYVSNFEFSGDVTEVYGGGFDLDGVRDSTILSPRVFSSQAIAKGIQTGDTNANGGGHNVRIIGGHIAGCNAGSIVLNQADSCLVSGTTVDHPTGAAVIPILLYSLNLNTKDNVVTNCVINYPDANFCIAESDDATGTGFDSTTRNYVFGNTCIGGNKGEFYKDPNSVSTTGYTFSTNVSTPTNRSEFFMQREGQGTSAALKGYTINTSTQKQRFQIQDYRDGSTEDSLLNVSLEGAANTGIVALGNRTVFGFGDVFAGGHSLNYGFVAVLGITATGTVYNDTRADLFDNDWGMLRFDETVPQLEISVVTSAGARVWVPLTGGSGTAAGSDTQVQFNDGGAFGGDSGFTWNKTTNVLTVTGGTGTAGIVAATSYIQSQEGFLTTSSATTSIQSASGGVTAKWLIATESIFGIAVAAPAVSAASQGKLHFNSTSNKWEYSENGSSWAVAFGTSTVAGANTEVQFNNSGAFGASSNFTWTNGSKLLTVTGNTGTASIVTVTSYIQSAEGFLTTSASSTAVNVASGGVTALSLISIRNDAASGLTLSRTSGTANNWGLGVDANGDLFIRDETAAVVPMKFARASGVVTIKNHTIDFDNIQLNTLGSGTRNAFIDFVGDTTYTDFGLRIHRLASGPNAASQFRHRGSGDMTFDVVDAGSVSFNTSSLTRMSVNSSGTVTIGSTVAIDQSGNITMSAVLLANGASGGVNVSAATATNAIQAPSGGVTAKWLITTESIFGIAVATPSVSGAGQGKLHFNSGTNKWRYSENGSSWADCFGSTANVASLNTLTGALTITAGAGISVTPSSPNIAIANTGVTSVTGTSNQVSVSASTGAVTFSLPQNIHTGASPTFNALTITTTAQSSNTSTGITFQNTNGNFQVNGNGAVSIAGVLTSISGVNVISTTANNAIQSSGGVNSVNGYYVSGNQVINSSGILSNSFGVNVNAGCAATGFNIYGGSYFGVSFATFTTVDGKTVTVRGGIVTSVV